LSQEQRCKNSPHIAHIFFEVLEPFVMQFFLLIIGNVPRLVIIDSSLLFQTEEWTSEQRKLHRCQDSNGNEDKLEKYIRRYVISLNGLLTIFVIC
jgi:hypothetical protein